MSRPPVSKLMAGPIDFHQTVSALLLKSVRLLSDGMAVTGVLVSMLVFVGTFFRTPQSNSQIIGLQRTAQLGIILTSYCKS